MSADDYEFGWWRHKSHRKKCAAADNFTVATAIARVRRQRLIDNAISTMSGVLLAIAVVLVAVILVNALSPAPSKPRDMWPGEAPKSIRTVKIP